MDGVGGSATLVADLVEFLVILVDNVGPEQGCNLAQFERSRINDIQDKAKIKSCFFSFPNKEYVNYLPAICADLFTVLV